MLRYYCFLLFVLVFISCNKYDEIELTEHTNIQVSCEGVFTQENKYHTFTFKLSSGIGSGETEIPTGISMTIKTPTELISFTEVKPAQFRSDVPFSGQYGGDYNISFNYKDKTHSAHTKMPKFITIDSIKLDTANYSDEYNGPPLVHAYFDNFEPDQYMRFELYTRDSLDTNIWIPTKYPIYKTLKLPTGEDLRITLPLESGPIPFIQGTKMKLKTFIISTDIGEYLKNIADYTNSQLSNGKDYNPPYFFSNNAYGLCYGAKTDSIIFDY